jgi:hypothetical protein
MINMKSTKKNGAKRNPILALAILGLLVDAGATGALAAGLIPNLDTGVSGSVSATVSTNPLLTVSNTVGAPDGSATIDQTYSSAGQSVKFSSSSLAIVAPGSASFYMNLTVNRLGAQAGAVLINMKGIDEYTIVSLSATKIVSANATAVTVSNMGGGEWAISGLTSDDVATTYTLCFNVYVSQQTVRVDGGLNPAWDFSITEADLGTVS